jgi:hypothetical protein
MRKHFLLSFAIMSFISSSSFASIQKDTVNNLIYEVNTDEYTAKVVKPAAEITGVINIPSILTDPNLPPESWPTVTEIEPKAFSYCSGITDAFLPYSLTAIGDSAFAGCSGLGFIDVGMSSPITISSNVFDGVDKDNCIIVVGKFSVEDFKSADVWNTFKNILPALFSEGIYKYSITSANTVNLVQNYINDDLSYKGDFQMPLQTTLDDKSYDVTGVGDGCFQSNNSITNVFMTDKIKYIGEFAFNQCQSLTMIDIPASVITIGYSAFKGTPIDTVKVNWKEPLVLSSDDGIFSASYVSNATLVVPDGTVDAYKNAEVWKDFGKIIAKTASSIDNAETSSQVKTVEYYSADGRRLTAPTKGLNIVKSNEGKVYKIFMK